MTVASATAATSSNTILNSYLTQQAQAQAAANAATSSTSSSSASGLSGNLNTFLTILTTQLQHQDPTSATDTNQFTQELVQFAGVEQQLNTNSDLTTLINLQKSSNGVASALGYIGKYVEVPSTSQLPLQNSKAEIGYTLPSNVNKVALTITDASGKTVANLTGTTTAGLNYISWDGKDSSGNQLPDGSYTFNVAATDSTGAAVR